MCELSKAGAVDSISNFKRQTAKLMKRMKKSGEPLILTVHGKPELVVQDAITYERWLEVIERAEAIVGIQQGLESMRRGEGKSIAEVFDGLNSRTP